jgi:UDP-N-acetylmuramoyl-tripeptide--D-alanyl-D-alanine ligase
MEPRPLADVAAAVGAPLPPGADPWLMVGPDVVIDSRRATPGSLFVALRGEQADGHAYVGAAFERGAVAALVCHPERSEGSSGVLSGDSEQILRFAQNDKAAGVLLAVPEPLAGLADLARAVLDEEQGHLRVIALTGSSGKTTTKDLLAQVLAAAGPTVAPENSFNNEIGVPLTALRVDRETRYLVAEMGARGPGHITALAEIVRPGIGLVLNVGQAHAGEFGGPEATARAKGELVAALPADGVAVLNADDPLVAAMAARHDGPVVWFSERGPATVWAEDVVLDEAQCASFVLRCHPERSEGSSGVLSGNSEQMLRFAQHDSVHLAVPGRHQVSNALAAAACALVAGVPLGTVADALSHATITSHWRLEVHDRGDGVTVVNDAYNANPDSMKAAFDVVAGLLAARRRTEPATRLVAVLGDMLELGPASPAFHEATGRQAAAAGVTDLVAVGEFAADLVRGARAANPAIAARVAEDRQAAVSSVHNLTPPAIVLVKASRGVGLELVAEDLLVAKDETC